MKGAADRFVDALRLLLPAPLTIALLLTAVAFAMAFFWGTVEGNALDRSIVLLDAWEKGLWNQPLLAFAVQAMLMLALGHMLALSKPVGSFMDRLATRFSHSTAQAAFWVSLVTMATGWLNWGFGLIFGAILARKVGEMAARRGVAINYPLVGAAGYSGMLVWHGGFSGSATIKAAEPGHLQALLAGSGMEGIPDQVLPATTVFSAMNLTVTVAVFAAVAFFMGWMGKRSAALPLRIDGGFETTTDAEAAVGAERLDHSRWMAYFTGAVFVGMAIYRALSHPNAAGLGFMTPDWINLLLFGLCFIAHGSIYRFLTALTEAIGGTAGILIQFPLYFGIMGLITGSGLGKVLSLWLIGQSNEVTYPLFTFFSSGLLNVFVPSGGGQWAIQGPLIVQAALELNLPLEKAILAMAYGDQLTNMLQPFWALPLLGITGLNARSIAPYTLAMMLVAGVVFAAALLVF